MQGSIRYVFNFKLPIGCVVWQQESDGVFDVYCLIIALSFIGIGGGGYESQI